MIYYAVFGGDAPDVIDDASGPRDPGLCERSRHCWRIKDGKTVPSRRSEGSVVYFLRICAGMQNKELPMARRTKKTVARRALVEVLMARSAQLTERDRNAEIVRKSLRKDELPFCEWEKKRRPLFLWYVSCRGGCCLHYPVGDVGIRGSGNIIRHLSATGADLSA